MRQVPYSSKKKVWWVCLINSEFEFAYAVLLPALTFLFFASSSPFHPFLTHASAALYYGLCLAAVKWGGILPSAFLMQASDRSNRSLNFFLSWLGLVLLLLFAILSLYCARPVLMLLGFCFYGLLDTHKPNALAYVADLTNEPSRVVAMGWLQAALALGACLGPIVGGYLIRHHQASVRVYLFPFLLALVAAAFILCIYFKIKRFKVVSSSEKERPASLVQAYRYIFKAPGVSWLMLVLVFNQVAWSAYYEFLPPLLKTVFHFTSLSLGLFLGLTSLCLLLSALFLVKIIHSLCSENGAFLLATASFVFGIALSLLAANIGNTGLAHVLLWIGAACCAIGDVAFYTFLVNKMSVLLPQHMRGRGAGILFILISLIWGSMAFLGGFLLSYSPRAMLALAFIFSMLMFFCVTFRGALLLGDEQ